MKPYLKQSDAEQMLCMACSRSVVGICPLRGSEPSNPEKSKCGTVKSLRSLKSPGIVTTRLRVGRLTTERSEPLVKHEDAQHVICSSCLKDYKKTCPYRKSGIEDECPLVEHLAKLRHYDLP